MTDSSDTLFIAGLGNPGAGNADTRHNAGFMALNIFSARYRLTSHAAIDQSTVAAGEVLDKSIILAWPMVLMEKSGKLVKDLLRHFKIEDLSRVLVLHDDADLETGSLKLSFGGGPDSHEGYKSVKEELGADFAHLHIGIGRPPEVSDGPKLSLKEYVLSPFEFDELETIRPRLMSASVAALKWAAGGFEAAKEFISESSG